MSEYITITDSGFTGCLRGQLVAYAGDHYIPAYAAWERLDDGSLRPAATSYICGVLLTAPDISGNGTLLVDGVITDETILSVIFGTAAPEAGAYYLTDEGRAARYVTPGLLPVYCGTVTATKHFIFHAIAPAYDGHRHTNYPLSAALFSSGVYDPSGSDTTFTQLMAGLPPSAVTVLSNGQLLTQGTDYTISNGSLTVSGGSTGYSICGINPLIGTNPEVRAIAPAAGNSITSVTKLYGTVYVDNAFPVTGATTTSGGVCISDISRVGVQQSTVVNQIVGAGGVNATTSDGICTISDVTSGAYLDFQTINANNVLVGATADDALLTFPSGVAASVVGIVRLPQRQSGSWTGTVFTWATSGGNLAVSGTYTMPPTSFGGATSSGSISGTANTSSMFTAPGGSLIQVTLSNNSARAQIIAAGVYLES